MNMDAIPKVGTEHLTLSEQVYRELRSAIIYQRIPPGQQLRSEELSSRLGVSRTPVKEALSRLRVEGLVDYSERHGFSVVSVTPRDLPEIYEAQLMIEQDTVENGLANATAEELASVHKAADLFKQLCEGSPPDAPACYDADLEFHKALVALSHNQSAIDRYDQLSAAVQSVRLASIGTRSGFDLATPVVEHEAIVSALKHRDVAQAMAAILAHDTGRLDRVLHYVGK